MKKQRFNNTNHVVGYCRYSSENQSEASIEAQQLAIQKFAKEQGLVIIKWYIDRAQSGTTDNRKEFRQMIDDSKERNFSQILVYQLDRFARNKDDSVINKIELRKNGVKVVSITERFANTVEGQVMESMIEIMADYYSKDLSRKTIRGLNLNASKAQNNGGTVPYGFKLVPRLDSNKQPMYHKKGHALHDIAEHPEQAEAVKIMFDMTLSGHKRSEIIDRLNELGYKRANGESFVGTSIDNILRNERYTGVYIYDSNKKSRLENQTSETEIIRVENGLPQIISKETFEAVQKLLESRVHRLPCNSEQNYLLTGKIFCGECGRSYIGLKQKQYLYYKCGNQASYKNGEKQEHYCHNNSVRKDDIETYVLRQIKKIVFNERIIEEVLDEYYNFEKETAVNRSLISMLENQIKDIESQIANIVNTIAMGYANQPLLDKLKSLEDVKKTSTDNLSREKNCGNYKFATADEIRKVYVRAQNILESGSFAEQREILHSFINKIFVTKNSVEIYLNLVPRILIGYMDMEIKNRNYTTIADLTPKQSITIGENGVYFTENNPVISEKQPDLPVASGYSTFMGENLCGSSDRT